MAASERICAADSDEYVSPELPLMASQSLHSIARGNAERRLSALRAAHTVHGSVIVLQDVASLQSSCATEAKAWSAGKVYSSTQGPLLSSAIVFCLSTPLSQHVREGDRRPR